MNLVSFDNTSMASEKYIHPQKYRMKKLMWRANLCATFLGNLVYPTPASKMLHFP